MSRVAYICCVAELTLCLYFRQRPLQRCQAPPWKKSCLPITQVRAMSHINAADWICYLTIHSQSEKLGRGQSKQESYRYCRSESKHNSVHVRPAESPGLYKGNKMKYFEGFVFVSLGPKGVINDWRRFKLDNVDETVPQRKRELLRQMSSPREDDKERLNRKVFAHADRTSNR